MIFLMYLYSFGQEAVKNLDFIIVIDEEITK